MLFLNDSFEDLNSPFQLKELSEINTNQNEKINIIE